MQTRTDFEYDHSDLEFVPCAAIAITTAKFEGTNIRSSGELRSNHAPGAYPTSQNFSHGSTLFGPGSRVISSVLTCLGRVGPRKMGRHDRARRAKVGAVTLPAKRLGLIKMTLIFADQRIAFTASAF